MDRLKRLTGNTWAHGRMNMGPGSRPAKAASVRAAAETDSPNGGGGSERSGAGGRAPPARSPAGAARPPRSNPIDRYIACFRTVRAAAEAAGISTAMLRRMRSRGYVSTRTRALLMAQACGFRVKPAELLALTPGGL